MSQSEYAKCIIQVWEFSNYGYYKETSRIYSSELWITIEFNDLRIDVYSILRTWIIQLEVIVTRDNLIDAVMAEMPKAYGRKKQQRRT